MIFEAREEFVNIIGRSMFIDGVRYLGYSCSAIEFECETKQVEVILWGNGNLYRSTEQAQMAVFINDEIVPIKRFCVLPGENRYLLYKGEEEKNIKIRLVKLSEAAYAKVGIKQIEVEGHKAIRPSKRKARRLEFIGDSLMCGYGIEGKPDGNFTTAEENPWNAYAAQIARNLEAEYQIVAWSGIGIFSSWTEQDKPNQAILMPKLYPYTDLSLEKDLGRFPYEKWDNRLFQPDCIIINLGSNDSSYTKKIPERIARFGKCYYDFIKQIRIIHPYATILCVFGVLGQELCSEMIEQVECFSLNAQDDKMHYLVLEVQKEEDGTGTDGHPSLITHQKLAKTISQEIRKIMEWK